MNMFRTWMAAFAALWLTVGAAQAFVATQADALVDYSLLPRLLLSDHAAPDWVTATAYAEKPLVLPSRGSPLDARGVCGTGFWIEAEMARLRQTVSFQDVVFAPASVRPRQEVSGPYGEWYNRLEPKHDMQIYFTPGRGEMDLFDGALVRRRYDN